MKTFKKEITYLSTEFNVEAQEWKDTEVTKEFTFKEISQTDREQHKLHFMIVSLFENTEGGSQISTDKLYDITTKFIKTMAITEGVQMEKDKNEVLNDSIALLSFGFWLLNEQITPFFSKFRMS